MTLYTKRGARYVPTTLAEQYAWGWQDLMVISAFRYCMGRMTYISGVCADWLVEKWPELPPHSKALIRAEMDRAFEKDDADRATGKNFKELGWDCDRQAWEKVRALWSDAPPAPPCEMSPAELAYRAKWLVLEMDAVGTAMVRQAQSKGDTAQETAGRDLQDAASALEISMKDQT